MTTEPEQGNTVTGSTKTIAVTNVRQTTPMLFGGLLCGMGGHVYRVVVASNQPTALECTRCATTWKTERVEVTPANGETVVQKGRGISA